MKTYKVSTALLFLFVLAVIYSCSTGHGSVEDKLNGTWLRSDGTYKFVISEVKDDGNLIVKYFNPNPINVGRAGWRIQNDELQIFVELQDENYPGSLYQLTYDEKSKILRGTYYQAVSKQTFKVSFNKIK